MENISATTQTENMIHDARTELLDSNTDGLTVASRLAHQWFGDYYRQENGPNIWLMKVLTNYFQGDVGMSTSWAAMIFFIRWLKQPGAYLAAWKLGNRNPIVTQELRHPDSG